MVFTNETTPLTIKYILITNKGYNNYRGIHMDINEIDFKKMSLKDLGDPKNLKPEDFVRAAALLGKAKKFEIIRYIAGSTNEILALINILAVLGTTIYKAGKYCNAKEKEYLKNQDIELKEIEEKCKNGDLTEEEKEQLTLRAAEITLNLQKHKVFKKWAKAAGLVFLIPFPANAIYYALNRKAKKNVSEPEQKNNTDK